MGHHQQVNVNNALQAFLIDIIRRGITPKVTEVVDKAYKLFLMVHVLCSEVFLFIYLHTITYKKQLSVQYLRNKWHICPPLHPQQYKIYVGLLKDKGDLKEPVFQER